MVTIIGTQKRTSEEGKEFNVLILQGGVGAVKSKTSGKYYITAKKTNIISTFDERTCRKLIGTELPGSIDKQECEPYSYEIPGTMETVELSYSFVYNPTPSSIEENVFEEEKVM